MGVGRGFPSSIATAIGSTRPPASPNRACFEGNLWILQTGAAVPISARRVSFAFHLLAASQAVGRRRRVAEFVAGIAGSPIEPGQRLIARNVRRIRPQQET